MSWEVNFCMRLNAGGNHPVSPYLEILEKLRSLPALFEIQSIAVHDRSLQPRHMITKFSEASRLQLGDVSAFVQEYAKTKDIHRLAVVADFWVPRIVTSTHDDVDENTIEEGSREAHLVLRGELTTWSPVPERNDLNLIWQVGNAFEYSQRQPESKWKQNVHNAMIEVETIIGTGHVSQVWGAGPDFAGSSQDAFLLYMNHKKDLWYELVGTTNQEMEMRIDSHLQRLSHLVEVKEIGTGLLVSTRDFFGETLAKLRAALTH